MYLTVHQCNHKGWTAKLCLTMLRTSVYNAKYLIYNNISTVWSRDSNSLQTVSVGVVPGPVRCQSHEWWFSNSALHFWAGVFPLSPPLLQSAPAARGHTDAPPGQSSAQANTHTGTHRRWRKVKTSFPLIYIKHLHPHNNQYNSVYGLPIYTLYTVAWPFQNTWF